MASTELQKWGFPGTLRLEDGARDRLADVGHVAAGIAHDITNAVTVIKLYADLLVAQPGLDAVAYEHLRVIRSEADKASSLAWQVLDVAQRRPPELARIDLVGFLADFVEVAQRLLPPAVKVRVECEGRTAHVLADRDRLDQTFVNLTGNARQAIVGAGEVVFTIARVVVAPRHQPPVRGMIPGDWVRVQVIDTGVGIAPDVLPRVFEPFFSTKPPGHGTGLGLSQVQVLVEEHDGHVEIASTLGVGTTVDVWLPGADDVSVTESPAHWPLELGAAGRGPNATNPERVLVVEPDPDVRAALVLVVELLGYRALAVADGEDALEALDRAGDIRAVISDAQMAGLGGEGLARRLQGRRPRVGVILTGRAAPLDPGPKGVQVLRLRKPFSSRQVGSALTAVLRPT